MLNSLLNKLKEILQLILSGLLLSLLFVVIIPAALLIDYLRLKWLHWKQDPEAWIHNPTLQWLFTQGEQFLTWLNWTDAPLLAKIGYLSLPPLLLIGGVKVLRTLFRTP